MLPALTVAALLLASASANAPLLKIGDEAPMFRLPTHNPQASKMGSVALGNLVGPDADDDAKDVRVVLLSFFATWCGPCKRELPFLAKYADEMHARGLRVIAVAIDKDEAKFPEILELVKKNDVHFPVLRDRYNILARQYLGDESTLPSVFIIRKDGTIALVKQGYDKDASAFVKAEVEKVLAEK